MSTNDWAQTFDAYGRMTCAKQATTCASGTTRVLCTFDALDRARTSYHLLDTHSDVVGLVSTAAANLGTTSYDAYGGVLATTGTQGILGYQGDITDAATKQVDMGTRWYAPGQGRFTSRDVLLGELGSPMMLNQFAYAGMNPITMWDPTGMQQAGAESGGYCGKWCEAAQYDYCQDQGIACGSNSYGGSGYTYTPGPIPPQPAPPITYNREGGDCAEWGLADSSLDELIGLSGAIDAGVTSGFVPPDYVAIPFTFGAWGVGGGLNLTITRRGKVFAGVHGGGAVPGGDVAVRGGWIGGDNSPREINEFVGGWSVQGSLFLPLYPAPGVAGAGPSGAVTWGHPGDASWDDFATEFGGAAGTVGASATVSYAWELPFEAPWEW